jgi:hypothetical protein
MKVVLIDPSIEDIQNAKLGAVFATKNYSSWSVSPLIIL